MAVYKKLAIIQSKVNGLAKNANGFNYDYVDGNKVLGVIRPLMNELNLLLMPEVTETKTEKIDYSAWDRQTKSVVTKTEVLVTLKMDMTWVDAEDGEVVVQHWGATGQNAFDKGFGSALTYGERYYLLKLFHIPTDKDDVDAIAVQRDADLQTYYEQQMESSYKPVDTETYWKFIKAAAEGTLTKSGKTSFQSWESITHPDAEAIGKFNYDVENYKTANQIQ